MIIYEVTTSYHLLSAIVHKVIYHPYAKCALFVSDSALEKYQNIDLIKEFFPLFIPYNHGISFDNAGVYSAQNDEYVEKLFRVYNIDIGSCEEINLLGAHFRIGAYLSERGIPYIFWEEAAGLLSRSTILRENECTHSLKQKYCDEHGLYDGSGSNVIKRICNMNAQAEGFCDDLAEHFDVTEELGKLPEDQRMKILSIFTTARIVDLPANVVVFLTQHFANLQLMPFEDQALLYQLYMDYFFENEMVVFKPHPDDIMYYGILFPDCQIIRERFPSEFLPYMFTNKPKTIATVSSTGAFTLRGNFDSFFSMDFKFQEHFCDIHRYYAAVLLSRMLGVDFASVKLIGADKKLVENMFAKTVGMRRRTARTLYIVDDISAEEGTMREEIISLAAKLPKMGAMIFLNTRKDFCFHSYEQRGIWNHIVPMVITKRCIRDSKYDAEFFSDTEQEVIYFFSKDKELIKMADDFSFERELKYTGLKVSLEKLTPEQKQIKVLEGVLAATEERLLYYMRQEKKSKV